jgi:hypothetical protein
MALPGIGSRARRRFGPSSSGSRPGIQAGEGKTGRSRAHLGRGLPAAYWTAIRRGGLLGGVLGTGRSAAILSASRE